MRTPCTLPLDPPLSFHFTFRRGGGCHVTVALQPMYFRHVLEGSWMIVCAKYKTRNLACIVGFHMTSHYVVAQRSQSIDW